MSLQTWQHEHVALANAGLQVMRIQPNEAIYLKINNKIPGLGMKLDTTKLDLTYKQRYNVHLPDAYERLILDVVNGDKRLFIRNDELDAAWALFTPILKVGCCMPQPCVTGRLLQRVSMPNFRITPSF